MGCFKVILQIEFPLKSFDALEKYLVPVFDNFKTIINANGNGMTI